MSVRVIPAVPEKLMCKCDGCGAESEATTTIPVGWNRISARDKTKPVERPIYGDNGGWPVADESTLYEGDYCDDCSELMVDYAKGRGKHLLDVCRMLISAGQAGGSAFDQSKLYDAYRRALSVIHTSEAPKQIRPTIKVVVNGVSHEVGGDGINYDDVVSLAGFDRAAACSVMQSWSAESAAERGERFSDSRIMRPGGTMSLEKGMVFKVAHTGNA